MGDQLNGVHAEALFTNPAPPPPRVQLEAVFYDANTESVDLRNTCDQQGMEHVYTDNDTSDADGTLDETCNTVLLRDSSKKGRCCSCCPSYRSADPDENITPFAIILLIVLFMIYILNQADRLVLPVAIPSGLRCEVSVKNECRNLTHLGSKDVSFTRHLQDTEFANLTNMTEDCIHFNDYEQGLLTGMFSCEVDGSAVVA